MRVSGFSPVLSFFWKPDSRINMFPIRQTISMYIQTYVANLIFCLLLYIITSIKAKLGCTCLYYYYLYVYVFTCFWLILFVRQLNSFFGGTIVNCPNQQNKLSSFVLFQQSDASLTGF